MKGAIEILKYEKRILQKCLNDERIYRYPAIRNRKIQELISINKALKILKHE